MMHNNDIASVLKRMKDHTKAVENGTNSDAILGEIQADFKQLLELIKLFLISERDSYYGYFLMNMQFQANFHAKSIAGIKLGIFPPVLESNPLLLCQFTLKEILYIVCHEIDHIVLNHPTEMIKANPTKDPDLFYRFNLAADAAVNDRINYEIASEHHTFMKAPDGLITSAVLSEMFQLGEIPAMESYAYYFHLIRNKAKLPPHETIQNGQDAMMRQQNKKDGRDEMQRQTNGNAIVTAANYGGNLLDHDWDMQNDAEDTHAAVRELINASVSMMHQESRDRMPGFFISQVEQINQPPVLSWQSILKKYVGTIPANKRSTRMRFNRRQPERFDLSGSVEDKVLKLVVVIDTSASVDDKMIGQIMREIFSILARRKHAITIIECDAEIQRVYQAKTMADMQKKVAGRGGTCFSPTIEYVNHDRYFRDALLIYFTDGYGEAQIPRPKTYRNLWVVFDDVTHLSVKEPYGMVLKM